MDVSELRVLVVDDEPDVALSIGRLIRKELHCEVEVAESAASARLLFGNSDFDIVTLDYQLPDGDGISLLVELSDREKPPCSILVTGHGDEQLAAQAFRAGAAGYVVKDSRLPTMLRDSISKAVSHIALEEARASLQQSEEELKLVSDSVPILVARVGLDQRFKYVNSRYSELFGHPPEWFVGRTVGEVLGREINNRAVSYISRVLEGESVSYESSVKIGGIKGIYSVKHLPRTDHSGEVIEYFSFLEDVTESKLFEERLAHERDMLARLMETSPVAILLLTAEGQVAYVNRKAQEMLRLDRGELVGRSYNTVGWELYDNVGNLVSDEEHPFREVLTTARPVDGYKFWTREREDRWRQFSLNASPVLNEIGFVEGVIGTILDVTPEAERRSQLEFREQVLSNVSDAVVAFNQKYEVTYWSPAAEVVYGWAAGEVMGRSIFELFGTRFLDISFSEAREILAGGGQFRATARQRRKDGLMLDVEARIMAVKDISGGISGYVSVNRDMTERNRLEERLRAERDLARLIVDNTPVGILLTDSEGGITFMSPRATEMMGRSFEEAVGLRLDERAFDPRAPDMSEIPSAEMPFSIVSRTGRPAYDIRLSLSRPDGTRIPLSINASPVFRPDGELRAVIFSMEDITESIERDEELRRWGLIIGTVDIGMAITNAGDSSYELINGRYAEMHGYTVEELRQLSSWSVVPPDERETVAALVEEGDRKDHYEIECLQMRKDGSTFPGLVNVTCVKDRSGKTVRRVVTVQDVTGARRAEAELLRLNSELEGYAHAVSHDLRGPLAAVSLALAEIGSLAAGVVEGAARAEIEESMETGRRNLAKAFTLINELLALAEPGQHPPEVCEVEVMSVVREVLEERAWEMERRGCRVEVDRDMGSLLAHPVELYQVFSNLIGNSIIHNDSDDPRLEVRFLGRDATGANRYVVKDNGPGIPEKILEQASVSPVPLEGAPGAPGSGLGLGLALVMKVVSAYGGGMSLRNHGGAVIEFSLKDYVPGPRG